MGEESTKDTWVVGDIAVATAGASPGGIALFGAGGLRHSGNIVMAERIGVAEKRNLANFY